MHIFLIQQGVDVAAEVNPVSSYNLNNDSDIFHAALTLDQYIFGGRNPVDWVLFTKHTNLKFAEFRTFQQYIPLDSRIIFSVNNNSLECFYCRPGIYSSMGSLYKGGDNMYVMLAKQKIDIQQI
jgi:hypothetical protein